MYNAETTYKHYLQDWLKGKRYSISQQTNQVIKYYKFLKCDELF